VCGVVECAVVCVWCSGVCSCVCLVKDRVESVLVYWSVQLCVCGEVECAVVCVWCSGVCSCVCLVTDRVESGLV
jgi:hypothetical protein